MSSIDKEFELPQASVARILKGKLPDGVSVSKEAKQAFARSAGVFILYLTTAANESCKQQKRQTLSARDILEALRNTQFDEFIEPLEASLDELRGASARKKPKLTSNDDNEVSVDNIQVESTNESSNQVERTPMEMDPENIAETNKPSCETSKQVESEAVETKETRQEKSDEEINKNCDDKNEKLMENINETRNHDNVTAESNDLEQDESIAAVEPEAVQRDSDMTGEINTSRFEKNESTENTENLESINITEPENMESSGDQVPE